MLRLYFSPGSCALAAHIALEEAGADYALERVDLKSGRQRDPAYLALNPKGRVPALATDRGVLTETPALLLYIAQLHPAARLAPLDDPFALAELQAFNGYISSTLHVAHAHGGRGHRWADEPEAIEAMKRKVPQSMGDAFALIEERLLKGPWVAGDAYSMCDPYLFTVALWMERDGVDPKRFPRVLDHRTRMAERAAVKRALAAEATPAAA